MLEVTHLLFLVPLLWNVDAISSIVFQLVTQMLMAYLTRLSAIAGNKINCGPALTWMEVSAGSVGKLHCWLL